ncbi:hypothetical protein M0655_23480 (plasmid) [Gordonia amicalis]|uniref:Uncharacterized protein n=1 Tax=Gordonia terrae TaxID=2055 RepID=A0A2I1R2I0_9ACTN|nr:MULTISPECIES: hypothetical protein [Gordonia]MDH3026222.1 hypothetical protein [Gordonia alkanivorans]PKZ63328.1 hypothetical protein CYJ73_22465 [Gordonia terrae]UOG23660.1 hypothetical protein MTX80_22830 [Gordonia amicalis]UPW16385.1 hypothetical protein M0655_23480 [Gordonia amicalis]
MTDSRWIKRWPELFAGLTDTQVRGVVQAIDNNVLEGWDPQREDIEFLTRAARGEFTDAEAIAEAVAMASRARRARPTD